MEPEVAVLLEQYKLLHANNALCSQLAEAEHVLWQTYKSTRMDRIEGIKPRVWLKQTINLDHETSYEERSALYYHRAWSMPLFALIDAKKITQSAATRLVKKTRAYAKLHSISPAEALAQSLQNYDGTTKTLSPISQDIPLVERLSAISNPVQLSIHFRQQVKLLGTVFVEQLLADVPDSSHQRKDLLEGFDISLSQLIDELSVSIHKVKTDARRIKEQNPVTRKVFSWACEVLGLDFKYGQPEPIDMKRVSRAKLRRARDLHPDRNPALEAVDEYQAVIEAYNVLQAYSKEKR